MYKPGTAAENLDLSLVWNLRRLHCLKELFAGSIPYPRDRASDSRPVLVTREPAVSFQGSIIPAVASLFRSVRNPIHRQHGPQHREYFNHRCAARGLIGFVAT